MGRLNHHTLSRSIKLNYPNPAPGTSGSDKAPALNSANGASTAVPNWPERCRQCLSENHLFARCPLGLALCQYDKE